MDKQETSLDEIRNAIRPVLEENGVFKAEIFGSYARGEQEIDSDIDLLVEFESDKTLVDLAKLKSDLEEVLDDSVDVLTYNSVHPEIRDRVFSEAIAI